MADISFIAIKMYGSDESVFIPTNIKNNEISHFISRWECISQLTETCEITFSHNFEPARKWIFAIGITFPKLLKCFP